MVLMRAWQFLTLASAPLLIARPGIGIAQSSSAGSPPASGVVQARVALRYDPEKRCPELKNSVAEDEAVAVLVFHVGSTGVPSQVSVKSSSRSADFDQAAVSCVQKLRFQPAISHGDGAAIDSWQQLALKHLGAPPPQVQSQCSPGGAATESTAYTPRSSVAVVDAGAASAERNPNSAAVSDGKVGVCVCLDEGGKVAQEPTILQSSGDAGFDAAAIKLARAGHYRPAVQEGKPKAGCVRAKVSYTVD
jgi:TonB family protein